MFELVYPSEPAPVYPRPTADHPGAVCVQAEEMLPLVEPSGLVYGQAARSYCHSGAKVLHPVVHLHLIDRYGRLYLQKRSMEKDLLPGYWDTEELGLTAFNPSFLGTSVWETQRDLEFVITFAAVGHPDLHPDNAEVSEGRWWSYGELDAAFGKRILTPNFEYEFSRIREHLLALL